MTSLEKERIFPQDSVDSNWTRWETYPSPEDEFWFWEKISPEICYQVRDAFSWLPSVAVFIYWVGIYRLYNYLQSRATPVECKFYRITYNILMTCVSVFLSYKSFSLMPLPNVMTAEGIHTLFCVRRPMKNPLIVYGLAAIFLRYVHFFDSLFVVLDKKPIPKLQMTHHTIALVVSEFMSKYEEPYCLAFSMAVGANHCLAYFLSTLKAFGMKLPKWVSVTMLMLEVAIMLFGCTGSFYAAHVIQQGGECYRHPKSAFIFTCGLTLIAIYVVKVFIARFVLIPNEKSKLE